MDFAESVLAKTAEYNPAADGWRPLRSDDIPGIAQDTWTNLAATVAATFTDMLPAAAGGFRVPQGLGIGFYGFWISGADLGRGAGYRVLINSVKSCNSFSVGQLLMLRELEQRTGVPGAFIESDLVDPRYFSAANIKNRIESYLQMLDQKRQSKVAS